MRRQRLAMRLAGGLLMLLSACRTAPTPVAATARLSLEVVPLQASVLVDDRLLPRQSDGGLRAALTPGPHRVEVYAPGYFHAYRDVELPTPNELHLQVSLRKNPDAQVDNTPARPFGPQLPN